MADNGTSFEIDIQTRGADSAALAATKLAQLGQAVKAATEAVRAAEAAYRSSQSATESAAKAFERIGKAVDDQRGKALKIAEEYGIFSSQYQRASDKLQALVAKQTEAGAKADAAKAALDAEAAALDKLRESAASASDAVDLFNKQQEESVRLAAATANEMAVLANAANQHALAQKKADADIAASTANKMAVLANAANQQVLAEQKAAKEAEKNAKTASDAAKKKVQDLQAASEQTDKQNKKAAGALGDIGGPLGALIKKGESASDAMGDLTEAIGGGGGVYAAAAVAIVAIATAAATLTAAAIAGVSAVTAWAVGLADVARSARLVSDGIAGTVQGGRDLDAAINKITRNVPTTRDELLKMAADLKKAGFEGNALSVELEKAAEKAALAKFGPDFRKEMLSLPNQAARLKANFSGLFAGLRIEKLLDALSKLVDLFDETQVTGRAIKVLFESLFQPIIDGVVAFIPKMVSAFIQFEILVMKAMIAIKPFGSQIKEVAIAFGILAGIVALMTVGFAVAVIAPFAIIIGLAVALIAAIREVASVFVNFFSELSNMSLADIGTSLLQGLVNGITGGATMVIDALKGVVQGGINAAKAALGIASPSKVFAEIGGFTAEGMAEGVDEGGADVQQSLEAMVAPPAAPAAAAPAATPAAESGGSSFAGAIFNFYTGSDAQSTIDAWEAWAAQRGLAVARA